MNCCLKDNEEDEQSQTSPLINNTTSQQNWKISHKDFEKIRLIGKGNFGKVFLVKKIDTGIYYAMKALNKKDIDKKNQRLHTITEKNILMKSESPFIVNLKYSFQDFKRLYLVMEFIQGGELFVQLQKCGRFSEERVQFYSAEIILAFEYLHSHGIIYRDLKPENILINEDGHIKLTDFGLSKSGIDEKNPKAYTFCGTIEYIAPEIIKSQGYDKSVDFWSLGSVIYEMLSGSQPFHSENRDKIYKNIIHKKLEMKPYFSENAIDLLNKLLTVDVCHI